MSELSPGLAATIADHVYGVRAGMSVEDLTRVGSGPDIARAFTLSDGSKFTGRTGPGVTSGFGYLGKGVGPREGEALVAIRGTHMPSLADWATNLDAGLAPGPSGHLVHSGFMSTFGSFRSRVADFLGAHRPRHVHCVGHSLGGALATLTAASAVGSGSGRVSLYTFGSPRAGTTGFSTDLTRSLGDQNVFRVYRTADPVPMLPLFPFHHVPAEDPGYFLGTKGDRISGEAHGMKGYVASVSGREWSALRRAAPKTDLEERVESWIESSSSGSVQMFSSATFWMITEAITWLLKKSAWVVGGAVFTGVVTVLDQIAWLLAQGARISRQIAEHLESVVRVIFRFLGRVAQETVDLTTQFLRWVLDLLASTVTSLAVLAVQRIL